MVQPSHLWELSEQCAKDSARWFPDMSPSLLFDAACLAGEAGEVANVVKKIERGTLKPPRESAVTKNELAMEMADVLTYLLNMAGHLGIDLERAYDVKRAFNENRFGRHVAS